MAKKVYAVRVGRKTGIFETWEECKEQVAGFSGAEYKGFQSREEALSFLNGTQKSLDLGQVCPGEAVAYVDGSFDKLSGDFSYGMVFLYQGRAEKFCQRICDEALSAMHNVAGEIKGAEAAMRYAISKGAARLTIYHDYEGIAKWCTGEWRANKEGTKAYQAFYQKAAAVMQIEFVKVKGHSGDAYNDMADELAKQALGLSENRHQVSEKQLL